MNRNHIFNKNLIHQEMTKKIAIHEAGHAAAIYLGNKQKDLPPVFFQIFITPLNSDFQSSASLNEPDTNYIARIDGGRLIHSLPISIEEATNCFSSAQKLAYENACEADITNMLIGPLAEAKYIALRDGEVLNPRLVNINALHYYGGASDLESVNTYLECIYSDAALREKKITELFLAAFHFVDDRSNWLAIMALADYILAANKRIIECNEIIAVLEASGYSPVSKSSKETVRQF